MRIIITRTRKLLSFTLILITASNCYSQLDTAFMGKLKILDTANILRMDTADVPNDRLTKKILELKKVKTGIGLESIMYIKIMEEQQKPNSSRTKDFFSKLQNEIGTGRTSKLIENCFVNIYRRTFTETEIDDLIRFYKTSAGKKMEMEFLPLLVESAKAAEKLLEMAAHNIERDAR